jgi:hypothetical protein
VKSAINNSASVTVKPAMEKSGTWASRARELSTMIGIPREWQALLPGVRWNAA